MAELWQQSAQELAAAIRSKALSSTELIEIYLSRTDRYDPGPNSVVTMDADRARPAAAADTAVVRGNDLGPVGAENPVRSPDVMKERSAVPA